MVFICVFVKAAVDDFSVLACGVPSLCAVEATAITANNTGGKNGVSAIGSSESFAPCHLRLNKLELSRVYNRLVAILDIVLWDLTLVGFHFFGKEIHCEALLQKGCAFVFLICKNTLNCARFPHHFLPWCRYTAFGKSRGYSVGGFSFKEH